MMLRLKPWSVPLHGHQAVRWSLAMADQNAGQRYPASRVLSNGTTSTRMQYPRIHEASITFVGLVRMTRVAREKSLMNLGRLPLPPSSDRAR